jgi:hypothetical protein
MPPVRAGAEAVCRVSMRPVGERHVAWRADRTPRGCMHDSVALMLACHQYWMIFSSFFSNYTIHRRHSQRTQTHPYEYTHANPTPRSIFEDCADKSSRLTKSPQAPRCRRERRLPLKAQTPLNPEKFVPMRSLISFASELQSTQTICPFRSSRRACRNGVVQIGTLGCL